MKRNWNNILWFSIIEVLVAVLIFSIWLASVYAIIVSTIKLDDYNKNYVIAVNLAREQLELIRNYRDSNYVKFQKFNQINTQTMDYSNVFLTWSHYKIENDYSSVASFPISLTEIIDFWEWVSELNWKMDNYRLCIDSKNRYTYDCSWDNKKTPFYRYIYLDEVKYTDNNWNEIIVDDSYKVKSKVIWYHRWYHDFYADMILTDFKRL